LFPILVKSGGSIKGERVMKYDIIQKKETFIPITVTLTIESMEELRQITSEWLSICSLTGTPPLASPLYFALEGWRASLE
jgi:hypothetical protein